MPADYHFFWSGPFSQWYPCALRLDGHEFNCAEQAMMHGKAILFGDPATAARILAATEPGKQKALGREVRGFQEYLWEQHRVGLVTRINLAKFGQNKGLRRKLFQTGTVELVEASPIDIIWGIGLDKETARQTPVKDWPGQNLLGRILTQVRETLREEYPNETSLISVEE